MGRFQPLGLVEHSRNGIEFLHWAEVLWVSGMFMFPENL